jgi:putative transposase
MKKNRHTPEQIITKLREAEALLSQGASIPQVCKQHGITEQTYYRWRSKYGNMKADEARRLKDLEVENQRLKRLVADQALDIQMLREITRGKF